MSSGDVVLFIAYTVASVSSLLVIKVWLPVAESNWMQGPVVGLPEILVICGAALYVVSFVIWMVILTRHDLTLAYPTAIGLTLAFSTLAATVLLGETVPLVRVGGMVLIFLGIILVVQA